MQKLYPMLYKRTTKGKIQTWQGEIDNGRYRSHAGYIDGVRTTSEWSDAPDMNVGRANERLAPAQAEFIMDAYYTKKLKGQYYTTLEEIDGERFFVPMTAKKWEDWAEKVSPNQSIWMQPKLDGMRCIFDKNGLWSRNGEEWVSVPHIHEALMDHYAEQIAENPDFKLDGELYNHKFRDNFNEIASILRKQTPSEEELAYARENIQYWIYDCPSMGAAGFGARIQFLWNTWKTWEGPLVLTPTTKVPYNDIDATANSWIDDQGFEGGMVRLDLPYTSKRSDSLFKWKRKDDAEFIIKDILPGRGKHAKIAARVIQVTEQGKEFAAGILGSHEFCKELLEKKEQYIGKQGTTEFQNLTPDGIPRFGKLKAIRDYE